MTEQSCTHLTPMRMKYTSLAQLLAFLGFTYVSLKNPPHRYIAMSKDLVQACTATVMSKQVITSPGKEAPVSAAEVPCAHQDCPTEWLKTVLKDGEGASRSSGGPQRHMRTERRVSLTCMRCKSNDEPDSAGLYIYIDTSGISSPACLVASVSALPHSVLARQICALRPCN